MEVEVHEAVYQESNTSYESGNVQRCGEGLVGLVASSAEAVNLSDAPSHPQFSYRPETGEDPYRSFLGVPVVRGGQVYGVLTVQNRAARHRLT